MHGQHRRQLVDCAPIPNNIMAAPRRHPFIGFLIHRLRRYAKTTFHGRVSPIGSTGPAFLMQGFIDWGDLPSLRRGLTRVTSSAGKPESVIGTTLINLRPNPILNQGFIGQRHPCGPEVSSPNAALNSSTLARLFKRCAWQMRDSVMAATPGWRTPPERPPACEHP